MFLCYIITFFALWTISTPSFTTSPPYGVKFILFTRATFFFSAPSLPIVHGGRFYTWKYWIYSCGLAYTRVSGENFVSGGENSFIEQAKCERLRKTGKMIMGKKRRVIWPVMCADSTIYHSDVICFYRLQHIFFSL